MRSGKAFLAISLFGTETEFADGVMGNIERKVVEDEKITNRDFVVPGLPHCCSKGSRREIICPVTEIASSVADSSYKLCFSLPKGNYATCLLREYMKSEMTSY
jgi:tRNA pseudouridine13 synthase